MADEPNIVLEHLRHIRGAVDDLREDMRELRKTQAAILQILSTHETRQLRMDERLERIERRLELTEAPT